MSIIKFRVFESTSNMKNNISDICQEAIDSGIWNVDIRDVFYSKDFTILENGIPGVRIHLVLNSIKVIEEANNAWNIAFEIDQRLKSEYVCNSSCEGKYVYYDIMEDGNVDNYKGKDYFFAMVKRNALYPSDSYGKSDGRYYFRSVINGDKMTLTGCKISIRKNGEGHGLDYKYNLYNTLKKILPEFKFKIDMIITPDRYSTRSWVSGYTVEYLGIEK